MDTLEIATGGIAASLGIEPGSAFWVAMVLFAAGVLVDLWLVKSIRDRQVRGVQPVGSSAIALVMLSTLCIMAGALLLLG